MEEFLVDMGQPRYRGRQSISGLSKDVNSFHDDRYPRSLRQQLDENASIAIPES